MARILHTEASPGWGGQERRILVESMGMIERGHSVYLAAGKDSPIAQEACKLGIPVHPCSFNRKRLPWNVLQMLRLIRSESIDIVNTHSPFDSWSAGLAGKIAGCKVVRTRHISTEVKGGLNGFLLYRCLADRVVTTCEATVEMLRKKTGIRGEKCVSIPTGVNPKVISASQEEGARLRQQYGITEKEFLVGTVCVLRSWKGIIDLLQAAKELEGVPHLRWMIVGGGVSEQRFHDEWKRLQLGEKVVFTGHMDNPFPAFAAFDAFALLSLANEGVSQASLQAAFMKNPLITTRTGGLPEVCLEGVTGYTVPVSSPQSVAESVRKLMESQERRTLFGQKAHELVLEKFTLDHTLDAMEEIYTG